MKKIFVVMILVAFINTFTPANAAILVSAGKKIPVVYSGEKVSGKMVSSGDRIAAEIKTDIKVGDTVVFKQGGTVMLNVADASKARCWGNPGELMLINGTAEDAKGISHPIEFTYKITGTEKNWPKVMGGVSIFFLFPLALFGFVHGGQAELYPGKTINATLLSDFNF